MISCPSCRRKVYTRRHLLRAKLDGTTRCAACGRTARIDLFGRWIIACLLAILLSTALLYFDLFFSGHLFLASIFIVFGGWRALSWLLAPILSMETVPGGSPFERSNGVAAFVALVIAAVVIDSFMSARFEADDPQMREAAPRSAQTQR